MNIQDILISTVITILPIGLLIPETFVKCWDVWWMYVYNPTTKESKIYVCDIWDTEFAKHHELGHKIWIELLTHDQKLKYIRVFNNAKYFYRDYSKSDLLEDFADNYANLMLKRNQQPDVQKRMRLIKNILKESK